MQRRGWTRDELLIVIHLYLDTAFGRMHKTNPEVIKTARLIGRTPSAVAFKLGNFASLDPSLDRKGMSNTSKLDKAVWQEFFDDWGAAVETSEQLYKERISSTDLLVEEDFSRLVGKDSLRLTKVRQNQQRFRKMISASYDGACCISGIQESSLLVAAHIRPWHLDEANRLNPQNGLYLNALCDKAYEVGLITITIDYTVQLSQQLQKDDSAAAYFGQFDGQAIRLPRRFLPDRGFLEYHLRERFIG